jgi:hypothetical protein
MDSSRAGAGRGLKQPSAVLDNMKFMARIRRAFEAAHTIPDLVLLLGVEPKVRKSNTAGSNPCKRFRNTAKNIVSGFFGRSRPRGQQPLCSYDEQFTHDSCVECFSERG